MAPLCFAIVLLISTAPKSSVVVCLIQATLALSLPRADKTWAEAFSRGLYRLAEEHGCELIGGDTTQGPLNICITVMGEVPPGDALLRQGAQVGDDIYVSGTVGDARLALEVFRGNLALDAEAMTQARDRLEMPEPRVALGLALRGVANACIDLSDGLVGDLGLQTGCRTLSHHSDALSA